MDQIVKAATPEQIAAAEERNRPKPKAKQILPAGFEAEKTIVLSVPVEFAGKVIETVAVRRLRGKDIIAMQRMDGDEDMALLAIVTGLPEAVIAELDADDYVTLSEVAQNFLPRSFRAGAAPTTANGQGSQP